MDYQLVLIDWIDPKSTGGWSFAAEVDEIFEKDLICHTVGWIIKSDGEKVMIAGSLTQSGKGDQIGDLFVIPHVCIKKLTPLSVPKPPAVPLSTTVAPKPKPPPKSVPPVKRRKR